MSRSHKDRHKWKRKERKRTGKSDPAKIQLHRERFLDRIRERSLGELGYAAILFHASLHFDPEQYETAIHIKGQIAGTLPYLVENPADCRFLIAQHEPSFNARGERRYLQRHVRKMKLENHPCHFEVRGEQFTQCSCAIECPLRQWRTEHGLPECTKAK